MALWLHSALETTSEAHNRANILIMLPKWSAWSTCLVCSKSPAVILQCETFTELCGKLSSYTEWEIEWIGNWMLCSSFVSAKTASRYPDNNLLSSGQFFICSLKKVKWIDFYTQCLIDSFSLVGFKMRRAVSKERFALLFAWLKWLRPLKESRSLHQSHS